MFSYFTCQSARKIIENWRFAKNIFNVEKYWWFYVSSSNCSTNRLENEWLKSPSKGIRQRALILLEELQTHVIFIIHSPVMSHLSMFAKVLWYKTKYCVCISSKKFLQSRIIIMNYFTSVVLRQMTLYKTNVTQIL